MMRVASRDRNRESVRRRDWTLQIDAPGERTMRPSYDTSPGLLLFHARAFLAATSAILMLASCVGKPSPSAEANRTRSLKANVNTIVVIYAENRSFDNLYGNFPGANGIATVIAANGEPTAAYHSQKDRDGKTLLPTLPQTWGGVTARGASTVITQAQSAGLPNRPFQIETAFEKGAGVTLTTASVTRDLYHRFFENQMQINGGKNDMFAAWTDAGGLTMGHFDYSKSAIYGLAKQYVLADNFFQGAFGGSFLNHQYLICACAPEYPDADLAPAKPSITVLNTDALGKFTPQLTTASSSPASALDGPPVYVRSGNLTPKNYFGDGKFYAINTMHPAYQPSGNAPQDAAHALYADPGKPTTLPAQTAATIGDRLTAKGVSWKWYAGAWDNAADDGVKPPDEKRTVIYAGDPNGIASPTSVDFQPHHQPLNYYAAFDPVLHAGERAAHLKDYDNLLSDIASGSLPAVVFYKPEGLYNQHEGYANLVDGDMKIADLVTRLQASPQWSSMVIVITYDEFGGVWDHVAPPKADLLGPGTRIPAIIISPLAKKGRVDHTPYDTGSILRLITRRFDLEPLPGVMRRDAALRTAHSPPMGDLTAALDLPDAGANSR
jgi:acid phosphatase